MRFASMNLMSTQNIEKTTINYNVSPLASWTYAVIKFLWLKLPMCRTNFLGPKDVRAIEVDLWIYAALSKVFQLYRDKKGWSW